MTTTVDQAVTACALAPEQLLAAVQAGARSVGRRAAGLTAPQGSRRYTRIRARADHDVWLIVWGAESGVDPHDHGGAAAAFAVLAGELVERETALGSLSVVANGSARVLDGAAVHEVRNVSDHAAVSVHVYSPPLTSMAFYDDDQRELRREQVR